MSLHFPEADRLKKPLSAIRNARIHTVIPDKHVLQAVVERVYHVQRCYPQYFRWKCIGSYCSHFVFLYFCKE